MRTLLAPPLLALALSSPASAAQNVPAAPALPPLHGEALTVDAARQRLVLVGGRAADDWFRGTWEWDGTRWTETVPGDRGPGPRAGHALGFDPSTRLVVLFGGTTAPPPGTRLCDTWTYDGASWTKHERAACPTDRVRNASIVHDGRRGHLLLVEGPAIGDDELRPLRLWRWTGEAWALVDDGGPRRGGFSQAAFDPKRGVLVVPVLYGGPDAGVWEWDGRAWARHRATAPYSRQTYALAWDSRREKLVLKGGQGGTRGPYLSDAWIWDGQRWLEDAEAAAPGPPGRGGATLLDDAARGRLLYFGGYAEGVLSDFWAFDRGGWRALAR
jgi:hypothetical protein